MALGHPNYNLPFFPSLHEEKGNALRLLTQRHGDQHLPGGYYKSSVRFSSESPLTLYESYVSDTSPRQGTEDILMGSLL